MGALGVLLEVKKRELIPAIEPNVELLVDAGMWFSTDVRKRVLVLSGEA